MEIQTMEPRIGNIKIFNPTFYATKMIPQSQLIIKSLKKLHLEVHLIGLFKEARLR
jgi:hypothetical protein